MRHAPGRTLLAVLAIALGVALGFAIYLINRVAADEVSLAARSLFGMADLAVEASGEGFDENLYPVIARLPGVAVASPVVEVEAKLIGRRGALTLLGMDPYRSRRLQPSFATMGATLSRDDSEPSGLPPVVLSMSAARSLDLAAGDVLEVQIGLQRERFEVASVLPSSALRDRVGVMDIATVQWKFGRLGKLSRLNLRLAAGASPQGVRQSLAKILPADARAVEPGDATDDALRLSRAYRSNLTALGLVALFTGGFFVYSTQSLAVLRRRREFALLHALGVTRAEQLTLTLLSGAIVGLTGALIGLAAGVALAKVAIGILGGVDLGAGPFAGVTPQLQLRFWEGVAFCMLGTSVAVIGSLRPALDAARIPTASALKAGDVSSAQVHTHGGIVALLFAVAAAMLALPAFAGLPLPGYVSIALIIVGTVVAMPAVLLGMLRLLTTRSDSVPYEIAIAHLRGTARYATLSVSAIVVSFSLMIAMAIMVASFRQSLDSWTQKLLPADLYVRAGYTRQSSHFDAAAVEALRGIPGVERLQVSRLAQADVPVPRSGGYDAVTLIARDVNPAQADESLWMEKIADTPLPAGAVPVWVSEAAADLFALKAGAALDILIAGKTVPVSVRGVWRDYEYPRGAIVMGRETYVQLTADRAVNGVWIWLDEDASPDSVQEAVRERLPADAEYDMRTPGEIRRLSLEVFDRTFAVTYALELIAILIGLFGISAGTSAQVLARRSEFGVLRHIGLTRAQIAATLAIEGVGLGALGVLTGLVTGGAVSLILIYIVNRQSFHWSMDVHVPVGLVAGLSVALVASSALIAVLSGRQAMRGDVVRAVKEDW
jgi:putative ABC transport system permease protein